MQPYFFPYIGYFQLMRAVDLFIFYDDAQYMKGGWINRNRIFVRDETIWLSLPVHRGSRELAINQRHYLLGESVADAENKIREGYAKAPAFADYFPIISEPLAYENANVAEFNINLLKRVAKLLDINCQFAASSDIGVPPTLKGQDKVIDICNRVGASNYINSIGGLDLYNSSAFDQANINLSFLRARPTVRLCGELSDVSFLSIVHLIMGSPPEHMRTLLDNYDLVSPI